MYIIIVSPILFVRGHTLSVQYKPAYVSKRFCGTEENLIKSGIGEN